MPNTGTVHIRGYREFLRATNRAEKASKRFVRDNFKEVGEVVRVPAADDLRTLQPTGKSAAGLRTIVRARGVNVEQTLRKVTGKRPDWGATQMRKILLPNLESHEREIEQKLEEKLGDIADHFDNP
jgi:hypothetical protein